MLLLFSETYPTEDGVDGLTLSLCPKGKLQWTIEAITSTSKYFNTALFYKKENRKAKPVSII